MDKRSRMRRAIELAKDVLIVALTCSAVWLAVRSQLFGHLGAFLGEEDNQTGTIQTQNVDRVDAARPLSIVANLPGGVEGLRCGLQYDEAASDALFQQIAGLLAETLSSAGEPERISRRQWEGVLTTAPGMVLDFQGALPLPVLAGWLAGESTDLTAVVRRLALTQWEDQVALCYRDEESGLYYRCLSEAANALHLVQTLANLTENGAEYAFESEAYQGLDPDTLLPGATPAPAVYHVSNPMAGGRAALENLMGDLGISVDASGFYSTGVEQVARSGSDSLRLSERGVAIYEAGEEGTDRFVVSSRRSEAGLADAVEVCRRLAAATVGARCGQARLYLLSAREGDTGLEVRFGYCLNGIPVQMEGGDAACFLVRDGRVVQFELNFRSYSDSGETSVVMPTVQVAAALLAMGQEGKELLLAYSDGGGDSVAASWVAAGTSLTGER